MSWCILLHILVFSSPFLVVSVLCRGSHAVIFRCGGEPRFPSVNMFAVKDEVAGDNVSLDVQLQKHENHSNQRHFFFFFFLDRPPAFEMT